MFAEWIKKQYKCLPSLFTFPNHSDLLSYFISIRILRREGSTVSINGENAQLAQSHVIHSRMNSSQASWLFAQCSFHQLVLLPLPWGLTGLPTEAPPCDVHIVLGKLRPCVARWPKAAATPQQVATVSSFHPDSQFLSKEQCTRVAWNSRDFFLKASPKVFFFFNWSTVDLQCCVDFCCTEKWFSYIPSFSYSFPSHTGCWIQLLVLCSRTSLFIHSLNTSLHLLIPNSQLFPHLLSHQSIFYVCESICLL